MSRRATTKKKAARQVPAEPEAAGESPDQTPDELRESDDEPSSTPDKKSVRVIRTRAELDGGLVISLSMKTDTPELPAPVAEALQTLNLVDIK